MKGESKDYILSSPSFSSSSSASSSSSSSSLSFILFPPFFSLHPILWGDVAEPTTDTALMSSMMARLGALEKQLQQAQKEMAQKVQEERNATKIGKRKGK